MLEEEASMDDGSLFDGSSGTGAGPEGERRDESRDCRGVEHQSIVRVEMDEARAGNRLIGPGSGRRLQATDAVGRLRRVAASADRLGAVYAAGSGGGTGRAGDQDPSEGRVGVRSRRGLELQKKRRCPRSRRALTWRESVRGGRPIRGGSTPPAWCSSTRVCCRETEGVQHELSSFVKLRERWGRAP